MTPEQFRERIKARIEQDRAVHDSSLDEEIGVFVRAYFAPPTRLHRIKPVDWVYKADEPSPSVIKPLGHPDFEWKPEHGSGD